MINGTAPIVGRQVYDIVLGYGKIISVEPDNAFVVGFGATKQLRYSSGGFVGSTRRVYWENPIVVEPNADDKKWQAFVRVARIIYNTLKEA